MTVHLENTETLDITIYVLWCKEERRSFIEQQLKSYNLPCRVVYFKASKPDDSVEYITPGTAVIDKLQCCFRSHINALNDFITNNLGGHVLILEDDICLAKHNLLENLAATLDRYKANPRIVYVSIGYLPMTLKGDPIHTKLHMLSNDGTLYYDFSKANFTVWGSQAQLFSYTIASDIVDILHRPTGLEVKASVEEYLKTHRTYQNKAKHMMIDDLLPLLFSQGIVFPPLAVEQNAPSTVHDSASLLDKRINDWKRAEKSGVFQLADYYSW